MIGNSQQHKQTLLVEDESGDVEITQHTPMIPNGPQWSTAARGYEDEKNTRAADMDMSRAIALLLTVRGRRDAVIVSPVPKSICLTISHFVLQRSCPLPRISMDPNSGRRGHGRYESKRPRPGFSFSLRLTDLSMGLLTRTPLASLSSWCVLVLVRVLMDPQIPRCQSFPSTKHQPHCPK